MNPRTCLVRHDPPNSYGDCVRACVATLIDRDDVPHVFDSRPGEEAYAALREYLAQHGKNLFLVGLPDDLTLDEILQGLEMNNPGMAYMLFCDSGGSNHAIVCANGKVFHDPNWYKQQITGPSSIGWVIGVIVCR